MAGPRAVVRGRLLLAGTASSPTGQGVAGQRLLAGGTSVSDSVGPCIDVAHLCGPSTRWETITGTEPSRRQPNFFHRALPSSMQIDVKCEPAREVLRRTAAP